MWKRTIISWYECACDLGPCGLRAEWVPFLSWLLPLLPSPCALVLLCAHPAIGLSSNPHHTDLYTFVQQTNVANNRKQSLLSIIIAPRRIIINSRVRCFHFNSPISLMVWLWAIKTGTSKWNTFFAYRMMPPISHLLYCCCLCCCCCCYYYYCYWCHSSKTKTDINTQTTTEPMCTHR